MGGSSRRFGDVAVGTAVLVSLGILTLSDMRADASVVTRGRPSPSSPRAEARPGRTFLYLLPDSELWLLGPAEGEILPLDGRLALVPVVSRGRPVYRIVEADLEVYNRLGVRLGSLSGTGMFWPMLPDRLQRMTLDIDGDHFDSEYAWYSPSRDFRVTLTDAHLFYGRILYLHLSHVPSTMDLGR